MSTVRLWNTRIIDLCAIFCCNQKTEKKGLFSIPFKHRFVFIRIAKHFFVFFVVLLWFFKRTINEQPEAVRSHCAASLSLHHPLRHQFACKKVQERGDSSCSRPGRRRNQSPGEKWGGKVRFFRYLKHLLRLRLHPTGDARREKSLLKHNFT